MTRCFIEHDGNSYDVKPSSKLIFDFLKSTRECYIVKDLAEKVNLAVAGIGRYIKELKDLGLVKVVQYSEGSVRYKRVCCIETIVNAYKNTTITQNTVKTLKKEKPIAVSTSGYYIAESTSGYEKMPENIKTKLHFLLHSEFSKWNKKSDAYLLMVKEVSEYFDIDYTKKAEVN